MSTWQRWTALTALAVTIATGRAAADHLLIAAGIGESAAGPALAGDLEVRFGPVIASARIEHGQTLLIGGDLIASRRTTAARWDDACVSRLRTAAATARCWDGVVRREPAVVIERSLGAALGVRRDGDRLDAVAELRLHPTSDSIGDVIELGATLPVAGRDAMYVHHARLSPGWYARTQWRISLLRLGGEVGMTGLASRTSGAPRADAYAIATLAVAVAL